MALIFGFSERIFLKWQLCNVSISFDSRMKAFQEDDVLQENVIIHIIKSADRINNKVQYHQAPDRMTIPQLCGK